MLIDTHEHCFCSETGKIQNGELMNVFEMNNIQFVEIGIDCYDIDAMIAAVENEKVCIGAVLGEHPKLITADAEIEKIFDYVKERVVRYRHQVRGIKTGLDYYRVTDGCARGNQRKLLKMFLEYASEEKLSVVLHVRAEKWGRGLCDADVDLLAAINEVSYKEKMVIHCFDGTPEKAAKYLEVNNNTYFGIGGLITYQGREMLIEAVKSIPKERILLESDGPYVKPFYPDGRRPRGNNSSINLPLVVSKLAEIWEMTTDEVEEMALRNAYEFYGM